MSGAKKDSRLKGQEYQVLTNLKRTPNHPTKSHIVVAKEGNKIKTIRFGQQGKKVGTLSRLQANLKQESQHV